MRMKKIPSTTKMQGLSPKVLHKKTFKNMSCKRIQEDEKWLKWEVGIAKRNKWEKKTSIDNSKLILAV